MRPPFADDRWQNPMKNPALCAILCVITVFAAVCAQAETPAKSPLDDSFAVALDIDHDGKPDHVALLRNRETNDLDLRIELGTGNDNPGVSRKPAFVKAGLASGLVLDFAAKGNGSLVITTGCGGCSNDVSTTLTIVHRGGEFLVAGFTLAWDTRNGTGTCDINFLTGKGTLARNGSKARPLKGRFAAVKLADWSEEKRPKECE
jgi:hypothetical protein